MSETPTDGRVREPPSDASDNGLELDLKRDSGSWRGAVPARIGDGPNAKTMDPEANQLDPEVFRHLRTASLVPIQGRPAEVASVRPVAAGALPERPVSSGWDTAELAPPLEALPPGAAEGFRDSSAKLPRASASTSAGTVRPMRSSSSSIRALTPSGEAVKAPYELAQDQKKKRMFVAIGVIVAVFIAVLLSVIGVL